MPSVDNYSQPTPLTRSQIVFAIQTIEKLLKRVRQALKCVINLHIDILVNLQNKSSTYFQMLSFQFFVIVIFIIIICCVCFQLYIRNAKI